MHLKARIVALHFYDSSGNSVGFSVDESRDGVKKQKSIKPFD